MTRKLEQHNGVKQYTNAGSAIASGDIVVAGNMIGVALVDIAASGGVGSVDFTPGCVFSGIPKVTAAVFAVGEKLIWDVSAGKFDDSAASPATGDVTGAAVAWVAGTSSDTTCTIMLTPGNSDVA